jgi:hypothetical protein
MHNGKEDGEICRSVQSPVRVALNSLRLRPVPDINRVEYYYFASWCLNLEHGAVEDPACFGSQYQTMFQNLVRMPCSPGAHFAILDHHNLHMDGGSCEADFPMPLPPQTSRLVSVICLSQTVDVTGISPGGFSLEL